MKEIDIMHQNLKGNSKFETIRVVIITDIFSVARTAYSDTDSIRNLTYTHYDFLIESVSEYAVRATLKMYNTITVALSILVIAFGICVLR